MTRLFFLCWLALAPLMKITSTNHRHRGLFLDSYFYSIGLYVQPYTTTTADDDFSHEIKKCIFLGRKAVTNLDSIWKSRDIILPIKVHIVRALVFQIVMYGCESCNKKGWAPKNWHLQTVVLEKILESLLDSHEIKPVNTRGDQSWVFIGRTDVEAETPKL